MPPKKKEKKQVTGSISKSIIQGVADKSIFTLEAVIANLASHDDRTAKSPSYPCGNGKRRGSITD